MRREFDPDDDLGEFSRGSDYSFLMWENKDVGDILNIITNA